MSILTVIQNIVTAVAGVFTTYLVLKNTIISKTPDIADQLTKEIADHREDNNEYDKLHSQYIELEIKYKYSQKELKRLKQEIANKNNEVKDFEKENK